MIIYYLQIGKNINKKNIMCFQNITSIFIDNKFLKIFCIKNRCYNNNNKYYMDVQVKYKHLTKFFIFIFIIIQIF